LFREPCRQRRALFFTMSPPSTSPSPPDAVPLRRYFFAECRRTPAARQRVCAVMQRRRYTDFPRLPRRALAREAFTARDATNGAPSDGDSSSAAVMLDMRTADSAAVLASPPPACSRDAIFTLLPHDNTCHAMKAARRYAAICCSSAMPARHARSPAGAKRSFRHVAAFTRQHASAIYAHTHTPASAHAAHMTPSSLVDGDFPHRELIAEAAVIRDNAAATISCASLCYAHRAARCCRD